MSYDRQIGTTGVAVTPELYIAFGISGAAQHVGGLGAPEHVVSVNTDPSCPMTLMADLGIVADAPAVLAELADRLGLTAAGPAGRPGPTEPTRRGQPCRMTSMTVDAVVVGAGPAGSAAALELARAGRDVVLVERGAFPGAKNVYGGVVYGRILDEVVPQWWTQVPVQRWVTRRSTMLMTPTQALTVDYRTSAWDRPPYNGMTTYRADFDSWLAGKAVAAGARLVTSTVATSLLRDSSGRIAGVRTDRPDGDIRAQVVIACDGVNSFLAKEAGLLPRTSPAHTTLGVKETLALPREVIDERFGLVGDQGLDIEMVGCTSGIPGGGFLYTNLDTVSVGVVVGLTGLAEARIRPEELVAGVKAHPADRPVPAGRGAEGVLRAPDPRGRLPGHAAAGHRRHAGRRGRRIHVPGRRAVAGGRQLRDRRRAGRRPDRRRGDRGRRHLRSRAGRLSPPAGASFVLADHKRLRNAADIVLADRMQQEYPGLACDFVEQVFTVTNPHPRSAWPGSSSARSASIRSGCGSWPGTDGRRSGHFDEGAQSMTYAEVSFDERMASVEFRVGERAHIIGRLRRMPLVHDPGVRACLPGQPVRADDGRRHPVQFRAVLRMRDLLSGVQWRGAITWTYPAGATASCSGKDEAA